MLVGADAIVLDVYGEPRPKGSKSAIVVGGHAHVIESKSANGRRMQKTWIEAVRSRAQDWRLDHVDVPLFDVPLVLTIEFWLPRPKSAPKRRVFPTVKPDLDKMTRLVGDVLKGVIYTDDAVIVEMHLFKHYAVDRAPGCRITVSIPQ